MPGSCGTCSVIFQFLYGTIISTESQIERFKKLWISIPLWYDYKERWKLISFLLPLFQFLYGTIISLPACLILMLLMAFQFLYGTIISNNPQSNKNIKVFLCTYNRTIEELKYKMRHAVITKNKTYNRTIEELKWPKWASLWRDAVL